MTLGIDPAIFDKIHPLSTLTPKGRQALLKGISILSVTKGSYLFRAGDSFYDTLYILDGTVQLMTPDERIKGLLSSEHPDGLKPMPNQVPCSMTAVAYTDLHVLKVDTNLLNTVLSWDQPGSQQADELPAEAAESGGEDWMTNFLRIRGFQRVPPENLQGVFMKMEAIDVEAGTVIVKQDTDGDYFYVIGEGRCVVAREVPGKPPLKLAEFGPGSCVGEDALISGDKRNATITMATPGKILRLGKKDFDFLLKQPMIRPLTMKQAQELVTKDGAVWLDVRMPAERKEAGPAGSISIPFFILRSRLSTLDAAKSYIAYCNSGQFSSTAAFLLCKQGLDAYFLKGGIAQAAPATG
jgi:CRP-like cAMP-binding protein